MDILKWAKENELGQINTLVCQLAAQNGYLEVLKWDRYTCLCTAKCGHFDTLKWAIDNGCPYDEWVTVLNTS